MSFAQRYFINASRSLSSSGYWTLARNNQWMDVGIVKKMGRAYDADSSLIPKSKAVQFPELRCTSLHGHTGEFPTEFNPKIRLVVFSFKHYGFTLVRSYLDPFVEKFRTNSNVEFTEICYVEHGFLSLAKGVLINNLKSMIPPHQISTTYFAFGNVKDFAMKLELPNFFTGYAMLLDADHKVRWQASGRALPDEVESLFRCTNELLEQEATRRTL